MTALRERQLQEEFTIAHQDFERGLKIYAFFKLSDPDTGEDLVQETFIKTWKYLLRGGKIDLMKAFLYHVLNNLIVDQYRKHKTTSLDLLQEKGFQLSVDLSDRLFDYLDGKVALTLIHRLPEPYKEVMFMRYMESLSLADMCLRTGQSKNALAVQAHRGLEKLKVLYEPKSKKYV